jgi:two-component system OmpR family sensor kinase
VKLGNKVIFSGALLIATSTLGLGASGIYLTYDQGIRAVRADLENLSRLVSESEDPLSAAFYELSYSDVDVTYVQADGTQTLLQQSSAVANEPKESITLDLGYDEKLVISKSIQPVADLVQTLIPIVLTSAAGFAALGSMFFFLVLREDSIALRMLTNQARRIQSGEKAELVQVSGSEDLRLLSLQLSEMVRELEQNQTNLRDFLYDSSHELKTPLTIIRGYTEILQKDVSDTKANEKLQKIHAEALKMQNLIADLLFLAQIESERQVFIEPVELEQILESALEPYAQLQESRSIEIDLPKGLQVMTDRSLLDRYVTNVVSNIYRHTPAGTPFAFSARQLESATEIIFDDAGPGLPAEISKSPGARFHSSRSEQGTGLGLSIMHTIANKLQAQLSFEKSNLGGLRVKLLLPKVQS